MTTIRHSFGLFIRSVQGAGQQCCYDRAGNLLPFENGGGTFDRAHVKGYVGKHEDINKIPIISHLLEDVEPYFLCCKLSFNCLKYSVLRPTDDCRKYTPPVIRECVYNKVSFRRHLKSHVFVSFVVVVYLFLHIYVFA